MYEERCPNAYFGNRARIGDAGRVRARRYNFQRENGFEVPTDGIWWIEAPGCTGRACSAQLPGQRAGLREGDILVGINDRPINRLAPFVRETFRSGIWAHATYSILRPAAHSSDLKNAAKFDVQVILEPKDRSINQGLRLIALVYLCIGIYVLFRRWTAPKSTHFYVFCLVSFVLYSFKYTTEFDTFDWIIYWANIAAAALQPALFLHFAVSFSNDSGSERRTRLGRRLLILPSTYLESFSSVYRSPLNNSGPRPRSCVIASIRSRLATSRFTTSSPRSSSFSATVAPSRLWSGSS